MSGKTNILVTQEGRESYDDKAEARRDFVEGTLSEGRKPYQSCDVDGSRPQGGKNRGGCSKEPLSDGEKLYGAGDRKN